MNKTALLMIGQPKGRLLLVIVQIAFCVIFCNFYSLGFHVHTSGYSVVLLQQHEHEQWKTKRMERMNILYLACVL